MGLSSRRRRRSVDHGARVQPTPNGFRIGRRPKVRRRRRALRVCAKRSDASAPRRGARDAWTPAARPSLAPLLLSGGTSPRPVPPRRGFSCSRQPSLGRRPCVSYGMRRSGPRSSPHGSRARSGRCRGDEVLRLVRRSGRRGRSETTGRGTYTWPSTCRPTTRIITTVDRLAAAGVGVAFKRDRAAGVVGCGR
jgi:hypothetical protein